MKSFNQNNTEKSIPLLRVLGVSTAILLVAGMMIGSGVFKKIIPMAQSGLSESWILGAWIIAGIITMLGAFTISGLACLTEESGGVYEYLRLAYGNFFLFYMVGLILLSLVLHLLQRWDLFLHKRSMYLFPFHHHLNH